MNEKFSQNVVAKCEIRMAEVTGADRSALLHFAECRLMQMGVQSSYGEDVTQRAFEVVMLGLRLKDSGRKPRMQDVTDMPAFLNYMRGVISSLLYALTKNKEFRASHNLSVSLTTVPANECYSPAQQAELTDLRDELFLRLRSRAPLRLHKTIDAWEAVFIHSDRIPEPGLRKYSRELRMLAKEVFVELNTIQKSSGQKRDGFLPRDQYTG
jgi:hypothetical protein